MPYYVVDFNIRKYASSTRARKVAGGSPNAIELTHTTDEDLPWIRTEVANGQTDLRLDPFIANSGIDAVHFLALQTSQQIGVRLGLTTATQHTVRVLDIGVGLYAMSLSFTRDATNGIWVTNASGSTANIDWFMFGT